MGQSALLLAGLGLLWDSQDGAGNGKKLLPRNSDYQRVTITGDEIRVTGRLTAFDPGAPGGAEQQHCKAEGGSEPYGF